MAEFERPRHQLVIAVLNGLNSQFLTEGWIHAEETYGAVVRTELQFALNQMEKSKFRKSCIRNLAVTNLRKLDRGLKILGNLGL